MRSWRSPKPRTEQCCTDWGLQPQGSGRRGRGGQRVLVLQLLLSLCLTDCRRANPLLLRGSWRKELLSGNGDLGSQVRALTGNMTFYCCPCLLFWVRWSTDALGACSRELSQVPLCSCSYSVFSFTLSELSQQSFIFCSFPLPAIPRDQGLAPPELSWGSLCPLSGSAQAAALPLHTNHETHEHICCCKSENTTISSAWHSEQTKCLYCDLSSHTTCQFYEFLK